MKVFLIQREDTSPAYNNQNEETMLKYLVSERVKAIKYLENFFNRRDIRIINSIAGSFLYNISSKRPIQDPFIAKYKRLIKNLKKVGKADYVIVSVPEEYIQPLCEVYIEYAKTMQIPILYTKTGEFK